jgi:hypothetical protein
MAVDQHNESTDFRGFCVKDDKVLISDLLYFLFIKFNHDPHDDIIATCLNFAPYMETEIFDAKLKFFLAIGGECIDRRGSPGKEKRAKDLEDILVAMSQRDAIGDVMPKLVFLNMHNIPWSTDGDATNAQILSSICDLKKQTVTRDTLNSAINQLRIEFSKTRHSHEFNCPAMPKRLMPEIPRPSVVDLTLKNANTVSPLIPMTSLFGPSRSGSESDRREANDGFTHQKQRGHIQFKTDDQQKKKSTLRRKS